jgi:hypothetical protein
MNYDRYQGNLNCRIPNQPVPNGLMSANNPYENQPYRKRLQPSEKIGLNKLYLRSVWFWLRLLGIVGKLLFLYFVEF